MCICKCEVNCYIFVPMFVEVLFKAFTQCLARKLEGPICDFASQSAAVSLVQLP